MVLRASPLLFILTMLVGVWQIGYPTQTNTTFTTLAVYTNTQSSTISLGETTLSQMATSAYGTTTGSIPASYTSPDTGQQICFYVPYHFHVDESTQRVVGTVSGSSPFNFYIMSQSQYNDFVTKNPPCGSSYAAITLDYMRNEFKVDWSPTPGDYYILLENISGSTITYTIAISAIGFASNVVYSTVQVIQVATSTVAQVSYITTQPVAPTSNTTSVANELLPIAIIAILIAGLLLLFASKRRRRRHDATRMY